MSSVFIVGVLLMFLALAYIIIDDRRDRQRSKELDREMEGQEPRPDGLRLFGALADAIYEADADLKATLDRQAARAEQDWAVINAELERMNNRPDRRFLRHVVASSRRLVHRSRRLRLGG